MCISSCSFCISACFIIQQFIGTHRSVFINQIPKTMAMTILKGWNFCTNLIKKQKPHIYLTCYIPSARSLSRKATKQCFQDCFIDSMSHQWMQSNWSLTSGWVSKTNGNLEQTKVRLQQWFVWINSIWPDTIFLVFPWANNKNRGICYIYMSLEMGVAFSSHICDISRGVSLSPLCWHNAGRNSGLSRCSYYHYDKTAYNLL